MEQQQAKPETKKPLHPFCRECGWRKGGLDSWNGHACKCGFYAEPMPDVADVLPMKGRS